MRRRRLLRSRHRRNLRRVNYAASERCLLLNLVAVAVPVPPPPESPSNSDALASVGPFPGNHASFAQLPPQEYSTSVLPLHASNVGDEFTFDQSLYPHDQPRYSVSQSIYEDNMISHSSSLLTNLSNDEASQPQLSTTGQFGFNSGQSPRQIDLLFPGSELDAPPDSLHCLSHLPEIPYEYEESSPMKQQDFDDDEDVEEVVRQEVLAAEEWAMPLPSPSPSSSSSSSSNNTQFIASGHLFSQPKLAANSPEMLLMAFDRNTCAILSILNGLTENPWRNFLRQSISECPALCHAVLSLAAFHASKHQPWMKREGAKQRELSFRAVRGTDHMPNDLILATTLVLAFAESWDEHISSGRIHLKMAKVFVEQALKQPYQNMTSFDINQPYQSTKSCEDVQRLRFLYNTWIYMDVIARLTSVDYDEYNGWDPEQWLPRRPVTSGAEIDPLMGCASTLFPYIGRVANLVRRVRKTSSNSLNMISQATNLKTAIESWQPPSLFESPQDSTTQIQDTLQTAEAYRWATLLYLHQAVPEIPSPTAAYLAEKVLELLATIDISSRTMILHIFPLFAAGCEADKPEDRKWVQERWEFMSQRMWIGNIDRCVEVTREVWDRRDNAAHSWIGYDLEGEKTVRGRLHWVRVMEERKWESEWSSASF